MQINELFTLDVSDQKAVKQSNHSDKTKKKKKIEQLYDFPTALDILDTHPDDNLSYVTSRIQFADVSCPAMLQV